MPRVKDYNPKRWRSRKSAAPAADADADADADAEGNGRSEPMKAKARRRAHPGTRALREIKYFQKSCDLVIPKAPFKDLVKEIGAKFSDFRFKKEAVYALQHASEDFLQEVLWRANNIALHSDRITVTPKDIRFSASLGSNGLLDANGRPYGS